MKLNNNNINIIIDYYNKKIYKDIKIIIINYIYQIIFCDNNKKIINKFNSTINIRRMCALLFVNNNNLFHHQIYFIRFKLKKYKDKEICIIKICHNCGKFTDNIINYYNKIIILKSKKIKNRIMCYCHDFQ